jgi:hypothetical protein
MQIAQVIALLMPETTVEVFTDPNSFAQGVTALLRDAEGKMSIEKVSEATFMEQVMTTGCFRRGKAIVDPVSRQVMGYEMEMLAHPYDTSASKSTYAL